MFPSAILLLLLLSSCTVQIKVDSKNANNPDGVREDQLYWKQLGASDLNAALNSKNIDGTAKNVILFVGDGMGPTTVTTSRIYSKGEKGLLAFEKFRNIAVLKTYSANKLVPDSCSTATALFCGVKANQKTSGVDSTVDLNDCEASLKQDAQLKSILAWAQQSEKATGFVTTTRVTHATPSALYAHTPNRKWECESFIPKNSTTCKDIARQLIEDLPGRNLNVIMGGGRQCLQSNVDESQDDPIDRWSCYSKDGRDLIRDWKMEKALRGVSHQVIQNNEELERLNITSDYVLGIFANGHMQMEHARNKNLKGMPSLVNMTEKAIQVLRKHTNGYVLVVEGGLIDFGHHRGHAKQALHETAVFSDTVAMTRQLTNEMDTLIIVTADHAHSLVFTGYPSRNTDIFGTSTVSLEKSKINGQSYTPLLYGTGGPNNYQYIEKRGQLLWADPSLQDRQSYDYSQQSAILDEEVTHSGTDVLVYANGPMANLFTSVHEQTYVAYVISYAAKIGPFQNMTTNAQTTILKNNSCIIVLVAAAMLISLFQL